MNYDLFASCASLIDVRPETMKMYLLCVQLKSRKKILKRKFFYPEKNKIQGKQFILKLVKEPDLIRIFKLGGNFI